MACVLTALIRMNQHLFLGITPPYSHQQCVQENAFCHPGLHGPADYVKGEKINAHRQIRPALPGADIGIVGPKPDWPGQW